jgi:3-isopropylmalate/(R)-2-methylmalate dehydratase small subunit
MFNPEREHEHKNRSNHDKGETTMKLKGKAKVFGDHVNTDDIIPARYLNSSDPDELAQHLMEDIRIDFGQGTTLKGSIIVAGENFGCGSSREHAPAAIQAAGIACVIAKSFARIFLRNSINIGLPVVELDQDYRFEEDDQIEVDLDTGRVTNLTQKMEYTFRPYPFDLQEIVTAGGWLEYVSEKKDTALSEYFQEIAQFIYKSENIRF